MNSVTMCDGCVAVLDGGKITVTIDTDRHAIKFLQGAGGFFQKASPSRLPARSVLLPPTVGRGRHRRPAPSRRAQNLLAGCIFDSSAVKSAFALLLTRVTEPRTSKFIRLEVFIMQRTISAMVGRGSVNHNSRKFKAENVDGERSHLNIDS